MSDISTRAGWVSDGVSSEWPVAGPNRPFGPVVLVIVGVMVATAVFWIGFMLAPALVLLIGYLALSAGDRARRQRVAAPRAAAAVFAATAAGREPAQTPAQMSAQAPKQAPKKESA
ncbi:MAG TPA: hypothetical protein VID29_09505 [Solirubrobacteraceae bacterium]|jgi:hypothetical protein